MRSRKSRSCPPGPIDSEIREVPGAPAKKNTFCRVAGDGSFGSCLAELRQRHNYTIRQLAEETKIREIYLEALEAEDYRNLPQLVYVMGYIRKLCALYGVGKEDADALTAGCASGAVRTARRYFQNGGGP